MPARNNDIMYTLNVLAFALFILMTAFAVMGLWFIAFLASTIVGWLSLIPFVVGVMLIALPWAIARETSFRYRYT